MNKQDVTKSLIELAVNQGIRDMKINSHRSIRRMADLGRQFAKGRFQDQIFAIFQRMLSCDDSPYYDMADRLLSNTDPACIKHFGMNIGYNGWTYGASLLRKKSAETGQRFPWFMQFSWHPASALTLRDIASLVSENVRNGTYCYSIRITKSLAGNTELFRLFSDFKDCAFLLDITYQDCILTAEQLQAIRSCPNLMVLLPSDAPNCRALSQALLKQRSLFAISFRYQENESGIVAEPFLIEELLSYGSIIIVLSADHTCSARAQKNAGESVLDARMKQKYPALLIEWDSDIARVDQIIYQ